MFFLNSTYLVTRLINCYTQHMWCPNIYFINPFFTCVHNGWTLSELYQLLRTDLVFVIDDWTLHKQLINMFIA